MSSWPPEASRTLRLRRLRHGFALPVAHRGLFEPGQAPENSLEAFRAALDLGFAMECDVRLDAAGQVRVFHDDALERLTDGVGEFAAVPVDELAALRLQGTSSHVPLLRELLELNGGRTPVIIELKSFTEEGWDISGCLEAAVLAVLGSYGGVALLKSFNPHTVSALLAADHAWPVGQISCGMSRDGDFGFLGHDEARQLSRLETEAARGAHFISYGIADLDEGLRFGSIHGEKPWMTWTVRTRAQFEKAAAMRCQVIFERGVLGDVLAARADAGETLL